VNVLVARFFEAYAAPGRSGRRILVGIGTWRQALLLGCLALSVQALVTLLSLWLIDGLLPSPTKGGAEGFGVQAAILPLLLVLLVFGVGRLFGGQGDLRAVFTVVAWFGLVTSALIPFQIAWLRLVYGGGGAPSVLLLVGLAVEAYVLWMLAHLIAAAHGFGSPVRVFAVIFGALLAFSALLVATLR